MPVTGGSAPQKVNLTRAQRRVALRAQLRDPSSTIWADADLNPCLDEALAIVHELYPRQAVVQTVANAANAYYLDADVLSVLEIWTLDPPTVPPGVPNLAGYRPLQGDVVANPASTVTNGGTPALQRNLVLREALPVGVPIYYRYVAARSLWTDDTTAYDLAPESNSFHLAELLFYAAARLAALRWALQIAPGAGGRDFEAQYRFALDEYTRLMNQALPPYRSLRVRSTLR